MIFLSILSVLCAVVIVLYFIINHSTILVTSPKHPDVKQDPQMLLNIATYTAAHEAGHAMTAWLCTIVSDVKIITIDPGTIDGEKNGGSVLYALSTENPWCELVIILAGIAGSAYVFPGPIRSGHATSDLTKALALAKKIDRITPPWKQSKNEPSLPFDKMFYEISAQEAAILKIAYNKAKSLLKEHQEKYYRLISALLSKRTLTTQDAVQVLGSRDGVMFWRSLSGKATFL